ncbi:MAG: AI-2E family transporter [Deltaproteobacteria bacterium]|nr:AI-2E family transporter [Deltaproteobacteria bacterium]
MNKKAVNNWILIVMVLLISLLFLVMIRQFLMPIFLAGIFSALSLPVFHKFEKWFKGRRVAASAVTVILIICIIIVPLTGLLGIVTAQAVKISTIARPWIEQQFSAPGSFLRLIESLPFYETIETYRDQIISKAGELARSLSGFVINKLTSATIGTINIILDLFIMLYCMFFFLLEGEHILNKILYYLPLEDQFERRMLDKFTSITRATLKGTVVIGILQGALAGISFAILGIPSSVFWGTIMAVLSVIPSVGSAIVWVPAAIILIFTGHIVKALILIIFCGLVVGSLDNLLRPRLVGKDTQMHELMILFGTLGGIIMFGMVGIIIGPIIAGLFVTLWEIFATEFSEILPEVKMLTPVDNRETCKEEEKLES